MSYNVFVASRSYGKYSPETKKFLQDAGCNLTFNQKDRVYQAEDLLKIVNEYEALIVGVDEVNGEVISKGQQNKLQVIAKNGTGVDNINLEAAGEAGIMVINAPGTNSESVADLTVALMLSIARSIPVVDRMTKNGKWKRKIGRELWEKTVGLIGTGAIGSRICHRLSGFNCNLLAYDIKPDEKLIEKYGVDYTELNNLLRNSDYVSLHLPLNTKTEGFLNKERLNLMKESAYLINTARGGLVVEEDLYHVLENGNIAGAACDVFSEEPPGDSKLLALDNFIATSHIGAFTYETNKRTGLTVAKNLVKALEGQKPDHLVNEEYLK